MATATADKPPVNGRLITVKNTNGKSLSGFYDLDADLTIIRKLITKAGLMGATDVFIFNNSALEVDHEAWITLQALLGEEGVELTIGTPGKVPSEIVDYAKLDYNDKLAFLGNGISSINVFNGLSMETNASDLVQFVRKFKTLFRFVNGYYPAEVKPSLLFDFESQLTFSEESHSLTTSGVEKTTVSLTTPWVSGEASYEHAKSKTTSSKKVRTYFTERHNCNKINLSIDPEKIVPDFEFIKNVKDAVTKYDDGVDKYQALVEVLNKFGWYIPLEFTLGSALYATKSTEVDSYKEATEESTKFDVNFKAEFKGIGAGAGHSKEDKEKKEDDKETKKEHIVFYQIGGSTIGKDDLTDWVTSLNDARNWDIIRYSKLYPSLLLLPDSESATFSECARVLRQFYNNKYVKNLQKYISVKDYEYEMAKLVDPFS